MIRETIKAVIREEKPTEADEIIDAMYADGSIDAIVQEASEMIFHTREQNPNLNSLEQEEIGLGKFVENYRLKLSAN